MTSRRWMGIAGWALWALVALLGLGGAAARPGGILLGAPTLLQAAVVIGAVAALAALLGMSAATACLGFLPIPLLLLAAPLPGIRALSGPPLLALALAGLAAAVVSSGRRPPRSVFFLAVFAIYTVVAARAQVQVGPQGDEPHYLMVADSILRDHDVSLEQDYAEGRYRGFFGETLEPHYRVRGKHGEIYSLHAVGLSLLILPAYAAGGYPAASFFMAFVAALLAREIRELVRSWSGSDGLAEGSAWVVALSPPLIHYAGLIFTEVPAALAVAVALRRGRDPWSAARPTGLTWAAAVAALPWLNARYAMVAVVLVVFALAARPPRRVGAVLLISSLASAAALAFWHFHLYGFFDPRRVYGRRPELSLAALPEGVQGLLLDQEFGLLAYAPVFALAVPGLFLLLRPSRRLGAVAAALLLVVGITAGSWHMWRGGFNPPARFLVPVLPVLAVCAAAALRRGVAAGAFLLVGWGLWTGLAGGWDPRLVHRDRDGTAPLFRERSGAEEWTRLLPAYVLPETETDRHRLALVWASALVLAALTGRRPSFLSQGVLRRAPWNPRSLHGSESRSARGLGPGRMALAVTGLLAAASLASWVSGRRTEGRDSARLVGRPALATPGLRPVRSAFAEWGPADLAWGPAYEPHRHPDGAVVGSRLGLPPGRYRLALLGQEVAPQLSPPDLVVRAEPRAVARRVAFQRVEGGWAAPFEVFTGEVAVTLTLQGGGALVLEALRVEPSTFSRVPGLKGRGEGSR